MEKEHSYMISVEVIGPEGLNPDEIVQEIEHELSGRELEVGDPSGNMILVEIGAIGDCEGLLDDGMKYRKVAAIEGGSDVLIWQDPANRSNGWGARVMIGHSWDLNRWPTAADAIRARDAMRDEFYKVVEK